jgi:hypothetical protein
MRLFSVEGDVAIKTPKRATCADFCASTIRTHPGNITRIARHANHFGFWILRPSSVQVSDFRLSKAEVSHSIQNLCFMLFSPIQNLSLH